MTASLDVSKNSNEKKPLNVATVEVCRKHGVPFVREMINGAGFDREITYCPKCEAERINAAREEEARKRRERLLEGIPFHYQGADLSQFDRDLIAVVLDWVKNPKGFLYVHGDIGVGKTHLACAVKKDFNARGIRSRLVFSGEMFLNLRKSFNKKTDDYEAGVVEKYAMDSDRRPVIFDDVGAQKTSEYTTIAWFNIIDPRYRSDSPTMITTNLSKSQLVGPVGDRAQSRICSGLELELTGKDRRVREHWTSKFD